MRYTIRHVTRFSYEAPIAESVMEARMQPRSDGLQRCLHFALTTDPPARVMTYQDHEGNAVHHFNIARRHSRLTVTADALVECLPADPLPDAIDADSWRAIDALGETGDWFEYLVPSVFARPSPLLDGLAREIGIGVQRSEDPLGLLRRLMREMRARFEYRPTSTRVDSPIAEALAARQGVCQDFAHIFIAFARQLGIPARYVSGYLFRNVGDIRASEDATHAWVECWLPGLGWIGLDPTNDVPAGDGHVRVAVGRDYADVPPTRGVYKGVGAVRTELAVAVRVGSAEPVPGGDLVPFTPWMSRDAGAPRVDAVDTDRQQQ